MGRSSVSEREPRTTGSKIVSCVMCEDRGNVGSERSEGKQRSDGDQRGTEYT